MLRGFGASVADVLIVAGQGVRDDDKSFMEYPDNGAYEEFLFAIGEAVSKFRYSHLVLSGGYTQPEAPAITEADGILSFFEKYNAWPRLDRKRIFLDRIALDLPGHLTFGLMAAREGSGPTQIGRVGFACLWRFKQRRINIAARILGIHRQFYFYGFAAAERADAGRAEAEASFLDRIMRGSEQLLMHKQAEQKRRSRYQGPEYERRLEARRNQFPAFFAAADRARINSIDDAHEQLQRAFRKEVMAPLARSSWERRLP